MKTHEDWSYIQNQFYNATKNSYKKFYILSTDHTSALKNNLANATIASLYNRYEPLHSAFETAYIDWKKTNAFKEGATKTVDIKQQELGKNISRWDVQIQFVYDKESAEYLTLLPNGYAPFNSGGREQRIAAVRTLADSLVSYPLLSNLQQVVSQFHTDYLLARDAQQQKEQEVENKSGEMEVAYKNAVDMMHRNLGRLLDEYGTDYIVTSYFQLDLVRNLNTNDDNLNEGILKKGEDTLNEDAIVS